MSAENAKMPRRDVDLNINMLRELFSEGHKVSMLITGGSMNPFLIHACDTRFIEQPMMLFKKVIWFLPT